MLLIISVAIGCVLLVAAGFLVPRISYWLQHRADKTLGTGAQKADKAPGRLGRWLAKPFRLSRKAADRSVETGREGRRRAPF